MMNPRKPSASLSSEAGARLSRSVGGRFWLQVGSHIRQQAMACLLLAWLGLLLPHGALAQPVVPVPALTGRVVDLTQTLDASQRAELAGQLEALEKSKGSQLVVLIVPSTQPEDIAQFSIRVAEAWKIGRASVPGKSGQRIDDGVILLVAKNDRKLRIEVGYGLEGAIPDAIAKRIITDSIAPRFKTGDYYGGIKAGVADLSKLIQGEALPAPAPVWQHGQGAASDAPDWLAPLFFVLILGFILRAILGRFLGSAAAGGAGWFTASMFGAPGVLAVVAGLGVFLFLLIFVGNGRGMVPQGQRSYRSGPVFLPGGFGGGGSRGGGGFGGGGFGGGGGGFGGGGASGDW